MTQGIKANLNREVEKRSKKNEMTCSMNKRNIRFSASEVLAVILTDLKVCKLF